MPMPAARRPVAVPNSQCTATGIYCGCSGLLEAAMNNSLLVALSAAIGLATIGVTPASAHHSFALFDVTRTIELEGTVKSFEWTNPHSWIRLEVAGPQNTVKEWMIEMPPAGTLAREGLG